MNDVLRVIMLWGVVGYIFITACSIPKTKLGAFCALFISGPICWVLFIPISIEMCVKNRKRTDTRVA